MKIEIRRPKALPSEKPHLRSHRIEAAELKREFGQSADVAGRVVNMSRTMDQAHAIAELMK